VSWFAPLRSAWDSQNRRKNLRDSWLTFYNTDQTGGNMQAEYERMRSEFAEQLPDDISRGNFYRLTAPHFEQSRSEFPRNFLNSRFWITNATLPGTLRR